jgi:hypothetical protein
MAARIVAQALVMGGTILGRAFVTAYQKALVNAAKNGGGAADRAKDKTVRMLKGMTVVEAESILGVEYALSLHQAGVVAIAIASALSTATVVLNLTLQCALL